MCLQTNCQLISIFVFIWDIGCWCPVSLKCTIALHGKPLVICKEMLQLWLIKYQALVEQKVISSPFLTKSEMYFWFKMNLSFGIKISTSGRHNKIKIGGCQQLVTCALGLGETRWTTILAVCAVMGAKMLTSTLQQIASLRNSPFDTSVRAAFLKFINTPVGLGGISRVMTSAFAG